MQTGTAVGLLVGGAVLLLSVSKPRVAVPGAAPAAQYAGGALNPFNWFGQQQQAAPAQTPAGMYMPQRQPALAPGYSYAGGNQAPMSPPYSPSLSPYNAADPYPYDTGGGIGSPANFAYPVMTPAGGFQSMAYMSPASSGAYRDASYSPAASSPAGVWV